MRNPLKSVKKLRDRVRRSSASQGNASPVSSVADVSTSPDSEVLTTPIADTPERSRENETTPRDVVETIETPRAAPKVGGFAGAVLQKGKAAVTKTVSFASATTTAATTSVTRLVEKEELPPTTEDVTPTTPTEELTPVTETETTGNGVSGAVEANEAPLEVKTGTEEPLPEQEAAKNNATETPTTPEAATEKPAAPQKIYDVHGSIVVMAVLGLVALFWLLVISICGVSIWETVQYSLLTVAATLVYCYLYGHNLNEKKTRLEALRVTPGGVGLRALVKDLPTWLTYTKKERVEWLNKGLSQMWPAYDNAVCAAIKESLEPTIQSVKPPIFKDIKFTRLRFGDAPFRIEGVEIYDMTESEIVLDIDVRWCSDANITLAIEPNIPSMTEVTRMTPKVTDISCFGTVRLIFKPLVSEIPGFGAVIATFVRAPTVRFNIDFGKALGGNVSGKMVQTALDSFIRDTLVNLYVWPQRYVIPVIYDEQVTGPIEDLQLRHVGLLTVKVIEARELPAADMNGYSDPTIELWTRPERKYTTAVIKKTLNPVFDNEVHHLLIQEPRSQNVSFTAYDVDILNVSDVFKSLNIIKNLKEAVYAKEFLGRASIPVRPAAEQPGEEIDDWYDFGSNEFGHADGPGSGCGSLHLKMMYTPFSMLQTQHSSIGAVLVTVIRCRDLIAMDRGGTSDPYVKVKLTDKVLKTHVVNASCDPEFHVNFEFFDIPMTEILQFSVFDKDFATRDDPLGSLDVPLKTLAESVSDQVPGSMRQWFKLKGVAHGEMQLKLQYIPMDTVPTF